MKTHNFKSDIDYWLLSGLVIGMVLTLGVFVNDARGTGCTGPCQQLVWDGNKWNCVGCDSDCERTCINNVCKMCGGDSNKRCCDDDAGSHCCPLGKSCCGNSECYDPVTQGCCNGTPYDLATQKCCCNGTPYPKCKLTDGEVCADPCGHYPPCNWRCTYMTGDNCLGVYSREYKGWTEKICSGGCPGECEPNESVCYIQTQCQTVWMPIVSQQCIGPSPSGGCKSLNENNFGVWCFGCEVMPNTQCSIKRQNDACISCGE